MSKPKITLYIDIVSPFAYTAYYALRAANIHKEQGRLDQQGTPGLGKVLNVPMQRSPPPNFPMNTLPILRALCAVQLQSPDKLPAAIDTAYDLAWAQLADLSDPAVLKSVFVKSIGENGATKVLQAAQEAEAKKKLSDNTEAAFNDGGFGLPWIVCTNAQGEKRGFWGVDRLGQVVDFLDLERPSGKEWRAML